MAVRVVKSGFRRIGQGGQFAPAWAGTSGSVGGDGVQLHVADGWHGLAQRSCCLDGYFFFDFGHLECVLDDLDVHDQGGRSGRALR